MIEPTLLAWCAGIVDGEGTIQLKQTTANNTSRTWTPCLQVSMCHEITIRKFHQILKKGKVYPKGARFAHWRDEFVFLSHGEEAVANIKAIQPYLVTKAAQAILVLEYHEKCMSQKYGNGNKIPVAMQALREVLMEELHELNKRGRKEG